VGRPCRCSSAAFSVTSCRRADPRPVTRRSSSAAALDPTPPAAFMAGSRSGRLPSGIAPTGRPRPPSWRARRRPARRRYRPVARFDGAHAPRRRDDQRTRGSGTTPGSTVSVRHAMGWRTGSSGSPRDRQEFLRAASHGWNRRAALVERHDHSAGGEEPVSLAQRNPLRKIKGSVTAYRLEWALGKGILGLYLNIASSATASGRQAASQRYFSRSATPDRDRPPRWLRRCRFRCARTRLSPNARRRGPDLRRLPGAVVVPKVEENLSSSQGTPSSGRRRGFPAGFAGRR
jgi:hypothetical protein